MRCLVAGAGAIGSLFSGLLVKAGVDLSLIGRPGHVAAINERGLSIEGALSENIQVPAFTSAESLGTVDLLIVTVKSYDTAAVMQGCRHCIGPGTRVLSLQNGIGNEDIIAGYTEHVIGGTTSNGVVFMEDGTIQFNSPGSTMIGNYGRPNDAFVSAVQETFQSAGLPCTVSDRIEDDLFGKFLVNVGVNGLASVAGVRNGELLLNPELKELFLLLLEEAVAVGKAKGFTVAGDAVAEVIRIVEMVADNTNSMLQDIRKGKRTEIDYFNGKVVLYGKETGIATPVNACITSLVKFIEKKGHPAHT